VAILAIVLNVLATLAGLIWYSMSLVGDLKYLTDNICYVGAAVGFAGYIQYVANLLFIFYF